MKRSLQESPWPRSVDHYLKKVIAVVMALALTLPVMGANASDRNQGGAISFPFSEGTLKQVLDEVERQSEVKFMYLTEEIDPNLQVSVDQSLNSVREVLEKIFEEHNISYVQKGNQVVLKAGRSEVAPQKLKIPVSSTRKNAGTLEVGSRKLESKAQDIVTGTVISSEDGQPLPGVTVLVEGTTNGVVTDIDGNFKINVEPGQTLVFSFIGFKSHSVEVQASQTIIDITLDVDVSQLDEVVVVGYGTVKKRDLTGAVASVKSEDVTRIPTHNAMEAIQGRVAGVDIVRSSGAAGAGVNIRIRGNRSIATDPDDRNRLNSPLYIIDGFQGGDINDLNPNDIASIEVLKDASSTAIYGYQGANGVVIVTTKKGAAGKTKVSYNGYYGINGFTEFPETRQREDYIAQRRWAHVNRYTDPQDRIDAKNDELIAFMSAQEVAAIDSGRWVDWVDLLMQNGKQESHTVSVTGGSEKTKAFASIGYFNEESMYRNNDFSRYNVRINLDHKVNSWVKAGLLGQVTYYERNGRRDPLSAAISARPLGEPFDEFGNINVNPVVAEPNTISPLADEIPGYAVENDVRISTNINAYFEVKPLDGLTYRSNFGTRFHNARDGEFFHRNSYTRRNNRVNYAGIENSQSRYYHWDNIISYNKELGEHAFTLTGVTNYVFDEADDSYANGLGQQLTSQSFYKLESATTDVNIGSNYTRRNTMSYAGRLNYSFKERYLLTLSGRYDRASVLSPGNRGAFFPSAAVAWRLSDEPFMSAVGIFDDLKFRASYGLVGNSNIRPYATQSGVVPSSNMGFGEVRAPMYQFTTTIGNNNVGWEKTKSLDLGIDMAFFESRLTATVDVYQSETTDILLGRKLPWSTGGIQGRELTVQQNIGSTETKGLELAINSVNIDGRDFSWKSTFTFTRSKEKITSLIDTADIIVNERESLLIGRPIQSFYTYQKLGIWQTDEAEQAAMLTFGGTPFEPGDIKMADIDGDSAITESDRVYLGSPVPKFILGLQNNFRYKGFDLNIYMVARLGQMIDADHLGRYDPSGRSGTLQLYDYWTEDNPSNDYPKPENGVLFSIPGYQTLTYVDGSYLKLKTLSLGYNFPNKWLGRTPVDNFRIYVTASNLWVKSKSHLLNDYDPEGNGSGSYPLNKQLVFGLNFGF